MKISTNYKTKSRIITLGLMALPFLSIAQENEVATVSYFSNALFNTLVGVIILLAIIIMALSGVLKNITGSDLFIQRLKKGAEDSSKKTNVASVLFIFFSLLSVSDFAGNAAAKIDSRIGGIDQFTFYFLIAVLILEIIFIVVMLSTLQFLLKSEAKTNIGVANKPREKTGSTVIEIEEHLCIKRINCNFKSIIFS